MSSAEDAAPFNGVSDGREALEGALEVRKDAAEVDAVGEAHESVEGEAGDVDDGHEALTGAIEAKQVGSGSEDGGHEALGGALGVKQDAAGAKTVGEAHEPEEGGAGKVNEGLKALRGAVEAVGGSA